MFLVSASAKHDSLNMPTPETGIPLRRSLTDQERHRLVDLAAQAGPAAAARLIGIHPQTYAALAAGFRGHRSTVALIERRLTEMDAAEADKTNVAPETTHNT